MVHIIVKTRISVTKGINSKAHPSKIITFLGHFLMLFVNWSNLAICGQSSVTVFSEKNSMCLNAVLTLKCPDISNVLREQRSRATNETLIKSLKKSPRPPQTGGQARPTAAKLLSCKDWTSYLGPLRAVFPHTWRQTPEDNLCLPF